MRLVTYENGAAVRCGALIGDAIAPLPHESVRRILEQGAVDLDVPDPAVALGDVRLLPPVPDPDKILCIGLNYHDHAEETGMPAQPGDIIATGTPAGVGFTRTPRLLISPDDLVEVEIENVGVLANPVVEHAALRR